MEGALHPKYRSVNLNATPGTPVSTQAVCLSVVIYGPILTWLQEDIWKFNPWRAPGKAPVFHSCGMAGGNFYEVFNGAISPLLTFTRVLPAVGSFLAHLLLTFCNSRGVQRYCQRKAGRSRVGPEAAALRHNLEARHHPEGPVGADRKPRWRLPVPPLPG